MMKFPGRKRKPFIHIWGSLAIMVVIASAVPCCTPPAHAEDRQMAGHGHQRKTASDPEQPKGTASVKAGQPESVHGLSRKPLLNPALTILKLEVKELSGDFEKWSKSIVRNEPEALTFRWSTNITNAKKAEWEIKEGGMLISRSFLSPIPESGKWRLFTLNYFKQVPEGKHTYTVRVLLFDNKFKQIGKASNPVTILFKPAANISQHLTLDQIRILSTSPSSGTVRGLPSYMSGLPDEYALRVKYSYDLVTEDNAKISQALIDESGHVAKNNFFLIPTVKKGTGTVTASVTIQCKDKEQPDTRVKAIEYSLWFEGGNIVEKRKNLPNVITFTCK